MEKSADEVFVIRKFRDLRLSSSSEDADVPQDTRKLRNNSRNKRQREEQMGDNKPNSKALKLTAETSPRKSSAPHPAMFPELRPSSSTDDMTTADERELAFLLAQSLTLNSVFASKTHMPYIN